MWTEGNYLRKVLYGEKGALKNPIIYLQIPQKHGISCTGDYHY
jgi:hypothetical protein